MHSWEILLRSCLDTHVFLNPHVLEWIVAIPIHFNTCGLKWIHMHPNEALIGWQNPAKPQAVGSTGAASSYLNHRTKV